MQANNATSNNAVAFTYEKLRFVGQDITKPWQAFIDIVALFTIKVGARLLYQEDHFPIVEFGRDVRDWLDSGFLLHSDFIYNSVEWEEPGIVKILSTEGGRWHISAFFELYTEIRTFDDDAVKVVGENFLTTLREDLQAKFDIQELPTIPT